MSSPRNWRPITWFAIVVNAIFPFWVLHGMRVAEQVHCTAAGCSTFGQGTSPLIPMLVVWFIADLGLGLAWSLTLPREFGVGPSPYS